MWPIKTIETKGYGKGTKDGTSAKNKFCADNMLNVHPNKIAQGARGCQKVCV